MSIYNYSNGRIYKNNIFLCSAYELNIHKCRIIIHITYSHIILTNSPRAEKQFVKFP